MQIIAFIDENKSKCEKNGFQWSYIDMLYIKLMRISRPLISLTKSKDIVSEKVPTFCQKGSNITIFHQKRVILKDFLQLKGLGEVYKCLKSTYLRHFLEFKKGIGVDFEEKLSILEGF